MSRENFTHGFELYNNSNLRTQILSKQRPYPIKFHILPYLPSQKQFPLNLSHVRLMHCLLQEY